MVNAREFPTSCLVDADCQQKLNKVIGSQNEHSDLDIDYPYLGEGNGDPLQYSCVENPRDAGEPSGLSSMGLHRVGHDWSNLVSIFKQVSGMILGHICEWDAKLDMSKTPDSLSLDM